ncbi:maleate cis-trans isomerase family protein [Janibacter corallicola]|uniref:maleate cis-trans isomerase family protein n=1 Tax=Janibacter corallicola TaxID=415212 RepID=UPI000833F8A0|nr:aspartate/glutamate racemase family protein [Janibacter corallicola]
MTLTDSTRHIGLIVPSSNLTMETELPEIFGRRSQVHPEDRFVFHSSRMRMKHVTPEELKAMNAQTDRAALELADARPDAVASACLVAIMAQGPGYHCTAEDQMRAALESEGVTSPVISSAGALLRGLAALDARRVVMVTPYMKPLTTLVANYVEDANIEVLDTLSLEVSDNIAVANLDPTDLVEHWKRLDPRALEEADVLVLSACVQMPSLAAIQAVEDAYGKPVISAAVATAWAILQDLGLSTHVPGTGSLLDGSH